MTLLVDDRAGSRDLITLPPVSDLAELCRLESGDAALVGNGPDGPVLVGVELKSLADLLTSFDNGRLQATQIPAMEVAYDVRWVLYYGRFRCGRDGKLETLERCRRGDQADVMLRTDQPKAGARKPVEWEPYTWKPYRLGNKGDGRTVPFGFLKAAMIELAVLGFDADYVVDLEEAAQWLGVLYRWWSKPWHEHDLMRKFDKSGGKIRLPAVSPGSEGSATGVERARIMKLAGVAKEFPGVGYDRAVAAAKRFGSIREMVNAGWKEWAEVPGIGKVIAKSVEEYVK